MKTFKQIITAILLVTVSTLNVYAQEQGDDKSAEKDKRPVRSPFENGVILNSQTTVNLNKKSLEFMIQHRFGNFENGAQDLWGIYGPANIRFGLNYGITSRIQAGIGTTKNNSLIDVNGKGALLRQTRSGTIPVSISYYTEIGYTIKDDTSKYKKTAHRLCYFHQLIVSRKFNDRISVQLAGSYAHFNIVDSLVGTKHNNIGANISGRYKFSPQSSIIFEYDYPVTVADKEAGESKPNLGIGLEVATSSHAFHVFVASSRAILGAYNLVYNQNDYTKPKEGLMIGFNITRNWGF